MDALSDQALSALVGAFGGILLGLAARMGRFCTLGAIEDALYGGSLTRIRMWALALGLSILGVFGFESLGLIAIDASIYAGNAWNPAASIVGGLLFGYGMAIAGNCGYGALARLGGGDMRSFVIVMVMGIVAYMTISGPLAGMRLWLFPQSAAGGGAVTPGIAHLLGEATGAAPALFAGLIAGALVLWAFSGTEFRGSRAHVLWPVAVCLAILSGWVGTTWIAEHGFDQIQVESHTFTAPVGETMLYLMTSSGGGLGFAVGSVAGVVAGAIAGSLYLGHFRWEACDDPRELGRQVVGGALMGIGAVVAIGCSVGQGLTAFSTLAYSAPVVLGSIFIGAVVGLRQLVSGFALRRS